MLKPTATHETSNLSSLIQAADQFNSLIGLLQNDQSPLDIARKLNSLEKEISRLKRAFVEEHQGRKLDAR